MKTLNLLAVVSTVVAGFTAVSCDRQGTEIQQAIEKKDAAKLERLATQEADPIQAAKAKTKSIQIRDDQAFGRAREQNTLMAYDEYLTSWPTGRHARDAQLAIEAFKTAAAWAEASKTNTRDAYEAFIKAWPNSSQVATATAKITELDRVAAWERTRQVNTPKAYREFIVGFPGTAEATAAETALKEIVSRNNYEAAAKENTSEAWEKFIAADPDSLHLAAARKARDVAVEREVDKSTKADELAALYRRCRDVDTSKKILAKWDDATFNEAKTIAALQQYIGFFPSGNHVREAKFSLDVIAWQEAQQADTREAYQKYLAGDHSRSYSVQANAALSSLEYRAAVKANSVETFEALLNNYSRPLTAENRRDVEIRLRKAYFDRAEKTGKRADWVSFINKYGRSYYGRYEQKDTELAEMLSKARTFEERAITEEIRAAPTMALCEEYLQRYPKGDSRALVLTQMEPLLAAAIETKPEIPQCSRYISLYPNGANVTKVKAKFEEASWEQAKVADWHTDYTAFLERFPDGSHAAQAKERLAFLKANKAVIAADCPAELKCDLGQKWSWSTKFTETGGKIGVRLSGRGSIVDPGGGRWGTYGGTISRGTVNVKAGGSGTDDYWCRSSDHKFCGGHAIFTWSGEDAGGHPLSFTFTTQLKDPNCRKK